MIAPAASRHSVAVSRRLYSSGFWGDFFVARAATRMSGLASPRGDQVLERPAARLEVGELVERRAGGREQHDLAGPRGGRPRRRRARSSVSQRAPPTAASIARRVLADQVDAGAALGRGRAQRREVLALGLRRRGSGARASRSSRGPRACESTLVALESLT